ncbi:MAG: hypothetical protein E7Z64_04275 [Thermoplasmata archaeon]|nr:hypothetical protein [Thermoplasmata archaeon]
MNAIRKKLAITAIVAAAVLILTPAMGLTQSEAEGRSGVVIDFGYWETVWVPIDFGEGMDGYQALDKACELKGYQLVYEDAEHTVVYSIKEQSSLQGKKWGMYLLDGGDWELCEDPASVKLGKGDIVSWARASGPDDVMPATDQSGFTYYSYAEGGFSLRTGEKLRVVSLAPSVTETICAVGGLDYIVGTDLYSNYPSGVTKNKSDGKIKNVGGYSDPNYEWIVKLGPDVVFCEGGTGEHVAMADKLRKSGIDCVVTYDVTDIEVLYDNIWIVASAMGLSENANHVIQTFRGTLDAVSGVIGYQAPVRTFIALSADPSPWTSGSKTFASDIISRVSGNNVFDSQSSSWFMVSKEQIHAKQPQVMIILHGKEIKSQKEYEDFLDRIDAVWKETPAYRNGNVYIFSGKAADLLSRPGPRLCQAAELLGKALHPDQFEYRDPLDTIPKYLGNDYMDYLTYQRGM